MYTLHRDTEYISTVVCLSECFLYIREHNRMTVKQDLLYSCPYFYSLFSYNSYLSFRSLFLSKSTVFLHISYSPFLLILRNFKGKDNIWGLHPAAKQRVMAFYRILHGGWRVSSLYLHVMFFISSLVFFVCLSDFAPNAFRMSFLS